MRAIPWKAVSRAALVTTALLGTAALSGCYYDDYGYTSLSVRSGGPGYYGYNNNRYYNPAPSPYWGWRGNYYYPGTGAYVYDHDRRPHRWNDGQRRYWEGRWNGWDGDRGSRRDEWRDFDGHDGRGRGRGHY